MINNKKFEEYYEEKYKNDISKIHDMLVDPVTKLPTLNFVIEEVKGLFAKNSVAIISIKINSAVNLEQIYGYSHYDELLVKISASLEEMKGKFLRKNDTIVVMFPKSDHFLILLSSPRGNASMGLANLEMISKRINDNLAAEVSKNTIIPAEYINFSIGYSLINDDPVICCERSLFSSIREAEIVGLNSELKERQKVREELKQIISREEIRTVFQPIVRISDFKIIGYEALTRGPQTTKYETPVVLFSLAETYDFTDELEWVCIAKAIINFNLNMNFLNKSGRDVTLGDGLLLFLNTDPKTYKDSAVIIKKFSTMLEKYGVDPGSIVLEITERNAIKDFDKFKAIVEDLKKMGFSVAIDDAGAGYSSLQTIAELQPKFLKFDMVLVRDIDRDFIKQELLKTLVEFANKTNSIVIAEGIETEQEYLTVRSIGAHLGQGYYFAKPAPQFIESMQIF